MNELNERKMLEREAFMVLHEHLGVRFIHDQSNTELGYTSGAEKVIYVAWEHEYFNGYSNEENNEKKIFFRKGIFAHELLHQCLTNFKYHAKIISEIETNERRIFQLFANTLEDPAIEYFADTCLGAGLIEPLKFSIREIYKRSEPIDKSTSPFAQLISALIQFGDMGLVKGVFTFEIASDCFKKIAPLYDEGIQTFDNKKRLDIAKKCFEIARPVWEPEIKSEEDFNNLLNELIELLKTGLDDNMLSSENNCGMEAHECESNEKEQTNEDTVSKRRNKLANALKSNDDSTLENFTTSKEKANKLADEDLKANKEMIKSNAKKVLKQTEKESGDFSSSAKVAKKLGVDNNIITPTHQSVTKYNSIKSDLMPEIKHLAKELRKIFAEDVDEYVQSTSGRYDILRGSKGTTAKMFNKKKIPTEIADMAVLLAVDTSGSMNGQRINNAIKASTVIVEAFREFNIPVYVMGFAYDQKQYVPWKCSNEQLSALAEMNACGGTDDTRAVKFAAELLRNKNNEHKFLFVISDGQGNSGLKNVVKKAKNYANVFSIGIGDINVDYFKDVYGQDFLHMESPTGLSKALSKKILKLVKRSGR